MKFNFCIIQLLKKIFRTYFYLFDRITTKYNIKIKLKKTDMVVLFYAIQFLFCFLASNSSFIDFRRALLKINSLEFQFCFKNSNLFELWLIVFEVAPSVRLKFFALCMHQNLELRSLLDELTVYIRFMKFVYGIPVYRIHLSNWIYEQIWA